MWQTKYALAIPKNLGVGVNFRPCSKGYFLSGRPQSVCRTKRALAAPLSPCPKMTYLNLISCRDFFNLPKYQLLSRFRKGTSINDVRRFFEIFELPTYLPFFYPITSNLCCFKNMKYAIFFFFTFQSLVTMAKFMKEIIDTN